MNKNVLSDAGFPNKFVFSPYEEPVVVQRLIDAARGFFGGVEIEFPDGITQIDCSHADHPNNMFGYMVTLTSALGDDERTFHFLIKSDKRDHPVGELVISECLHGGECVDVNPKKRPMFNRQQPRRPIRMPPAEASP
jgi:hypothetical protein